MNQNTQSEYYIGVILVVIAAITYSTAGLFTKGVEAGSWDVIFWRGFFCRCFHNGLDNKQRNVTTEFFWHRLQWMGGSGGRSIGYGGIYPGI